MWKMRPKEVNSSSKYPVTEELKAKAKPKAISIMFS